jgi:hypothetical protein
MQEILLVSKFLVVIFQHRNIKQSTASIGVLEDFS